ncbi:hypothetical protein P7K49_021166 [Saguinus oedipus]|uniref:Uncharacterized protein n=1 Tax=Saguinus oedipus TaxID=9490 RepID=A0ABQ9UTK4_SAGOE|nr:hypothetical protein P7K49_021166 [Saguinus oedipus]
MHEDVHRKTGKAEKTDAQALEETGLRLLIVKGGLASLTPHGKPGWPQSRRSTGLGTPGTNRSWAPPPRPHPHSGPGLGTVGDAKDTPGPRASRLRLLTEAKIQRTPGLQATPKAPQRHHDTQGTGSQSQHSTFKARSRARAEAFLRTNHNVQNFLPANHRAEPFPFVQPITCIVCRRRRELVG